MTDAAAAFQLSSARGRTGKQLGGLGGQKSDAGKPGSKNRKSLIGRRTDARRALLT